MTLWYYSAPLNAGPPVCRIRTGPFTVSPAHCMWFSFKTHTGPGALKKLKWHAYVQCCIYAVHAYRKSYASLFLVACRTVTTTRNLRMASEPQTPSSISQSCCSVSGQIVTLLPGTPACISCLQYGIINEHKHVSQFGSNVKNQAYAMLLLCSCQSCTPSQPRRDWSLPRAQLWQFRTKLNAGSSQSVHAAEWSPHV